MPTKKKEKVEEPKAIDWSKVTLLNEHDELKRRAQIPLTAVNGVTPLQMQELTEGGYLFTNSGQMATILNVANSGDKTAVVTVRSVDGKSDMVVTLEPTQAAYIGAFSPTIYNRTDNAVYVDVSDTVLASVLKLGT